MSEKKRGRPSKFNEIVREKILELARGGKTDEQIADIIGVERRTLQYWKTNDQSFLLALKENKHIADELVEASLFRKATGYTHKAVKIMQNEGEVIKEEYEEHYPPDSTAAIFWLKNRKPEEWRDKTEVEVSTPLAERLRKARDKK